MNSSFVPTVPTLLRAGAILCLACFFTAFAHAQGCTNASYYGASVYALEGYVPAILSSVPYFAIGREVSDGNGNVTGAFSSSTSGTAGGGSYTGTYNIAANCSGTETISGTATNGTQFNWTSTFEVSAGGRTGLSATNTTNVVLAGQAYRAAAQGSAKCGNASLASSYDFLAFGSMQGVPVTKVGQLTLDGNGDVTQFQATINLQQTGKSVSSGTGSYTVNGDCTGTMTVNDGFSDTFDFVVQEGGGLLLLEPDNTQNTYGVAEPQVDTTVLAQFAFNGGWYSALYFNNDSPGAVSFTVNFTGDTGSPLDVPALNGSSTTVQIPAGGSATVVAPDNTSDPLSEGYASFILPPGVTGYGVFRQSVPGRVDQEAVCPFAPATATTSTLLFDDTNGLITSVAIVNPSAIAATVQVTALDNGGNQLGTATIPLGSYSKYENALQLISGLSSVTGNSGKVVFTVSSGSVAVLGLRFDGFAFTSIPTQQ